MRITQGAFLMTFGVALQGCDSALRAPTENVPPSVSPARAEAGKDRVVGAGAGEIFGAAFSFKVSAQSGPIGEQPKGLLDGVFAGLTIKGKVTCLLVAGSFAWVGTENPEAPGTGFILFVKDNGDLAAGFPDEATFFNVLAPPNEACRVAEARAPSGITGDVVVNDAIP